MTKSPPAPGEVGAEHAAAAERYREKHERRLSAMGVTETPHRKASTAAVAVPS